MTTEKYNTEIPRCGVCRFFKYEDANGNGLCMLKDNEPMRCSELCDLDHTNMRREDILKGLSAFQKWRRGSNSEMLPPYVTGVILDSAIYKLRNCVVYDGLVMCGECRHFVRYDNATYGFCTRSNETSRRDCTCKHGEKR